MSFTEMEGAAFDRWKTKLPDEPVEIAYDWQNQPLYEGDICYQTDDGYVLEDDILQYIQTLEKEALLEILRNINNEDIIIAVGMEEVKSLWK